MCATITREGFSSVSVFREVSETRECNTQRTATPHRIQISDEVDGGEAAAQSERHQPHSRTLQISRLFENCVAKMVLNATRMLCYSISLLGILGVIELSSGSTLDLYKNARLSTRIVQTRYGRLQGLILPLDSYKFLRPIEAFLGVPYATPPIQSNR